MIRRIPIDERTNRRYPEGEFICPKCNKPFIARIGNVVSGNTSKCNNHKDEIMANLMSKDITNQKFGKLTAKYWTGKYRGTNRVWYCECDCGGHKEVDINALTTGNTSSCGCIVSKGENKIKKILVDNKIYFEQQKIFNDCVFPETKAKLRFDFYLPDYNCCIEYDGIQHFEVLGKNGNWRKDAYYTQKRDNYKNKYCKDNNIKLIRIPYTDFEELNEEYLLKILNNL